MSSMGKFDLKPQESCVRTVYERIVIYCIYAVYCTSFLMPATGALEVAGTPEHTPLSGWQAFRLLFLAGYFWLVLIHPIVLLAFPLIFLGNVLLICFPILDAIFGRMAYLFCGIFIGIGALGVFLVPAEILDPVFYGFYVWLASMVAMTIMLLSIGAIYAAKQVI